MGTEKNIKIAIADDHELFRKGVVSLVSSFDGFEVVADAQDGIHLIRAIQALETPPDICITDISMPIMDGYQTCAAIKKKWKDMKVTALTMFRNELSIIKMLSSGANGYMHKDISTEDFKKGLQMLYKDGYYYPENLSKHIYNALHNLKNNQYTFTLEEEKFLRECCSGRSYKEIAVQMSTSHRSVAWMRDNLFKRLQVNTRSGLVMCAILLGIYHVE